MTDFRIAQPERKMKETKAPGLTLTKPKIRETMIFDINQTTTMKIYQMNDCEWWMAESEEDAIRDIALHYGSGYGTDKAELVRDGYLNEDCPRELTAQEMETLFYVNEEYKKGPEPMEHWVCNVCGQKANPECRWNGRAWEHHHGYPVGHVEMSNVHRRSFNRELADRILRGVNKPEMFASTEF